MEPKKKYPIVYSVGGPRCPSCGKTPECPLKRICNKCEAGYMREWRKTHRLSGEPLARANARSYLHMYIKRGAVMKQPCEKCGATEDVQAHHEDYSKPLEV